MDLGIAGLVLREDLLEELDAADGRVEVEEDGQGQGDPLNDDPRHDAVESCLNYAGSHLETSRIHK